MTTFYRTRITINVLHEYPIPDEFDLADIIREGDLGSYVIDEARNCTQPRWRKRCARRTQAPTSSASTTRATRCRSARERSDGVLRAYVDRFERRASGTQLMLLLTTAALQQGLDPAAVSATRREPPVAGGPRGGRRRIRYMQSIGCTSFDSSALEVKP